MKSILKDFYDIEIDIYKEYEDGIVFVIGGICYYLYNIGDNDVLLVDKIYEYVVRNYGIKLHSVIKNKYNNVLSDKYVLMKVNILVADIDFYDIKLFSKCYMNEFRNEYVNLKEVWNKRIDYYSEKIKDGKYDSIRYLFDYFNCISEMLLKFIRDINLSYFDLKLVHKKNYNNTLDYYNPFNLTIDVIDRDLINYLKANKKTDELIKFIEGDYNRKKIIFFKLVFPYDFFEKIDRLFVNESMDDLINYDVYNYEKVLDFYQELFNYYLFS